MSRIIIDTSSPIETQNVLESLKKMNVSYHIQKSKSELKGLRLELEEILNSGPVRTDFEDFFREFEESRKDRKLI